MNIFFQSCFFIYRNINTPVHGAASRLSHSATHSTMADVHDIVEVDEEGDIENIESKPDIDIEPVHNETTPNIIKKEELLSPNKEV
jgi:hypothetical protein